MPRATQDTETHAHRFAYGALTLCGPPFQDGSARMRMCGLRSYYPRRAQARGGFGLFPGRSPLLGESLLFSLPAGTKMFQFPAFAPHSGVVTAIRAAGLSHSEIRGSRAICAYPRLIAAYHVLHRLREPRHPPYALRHFRLTPRISHKAIWRELILSAVPLALPYFYGRRLSNDARAFLFGGACAVFYSLACHNMSKIVFGSRIAFAFTARCRRRIGFAYPSPKCGE